MASWTEIPNSSLESGAPIRAVDGVAFRDNPVAIAEGAAGAPRIQTGGINDSAVTAAKINADLIGANKIGSTVFAHERLNNTTRYSTGTRTVAGSALYVRGSYNISGSDYYLSATSSGNSDIGTSQSTFGWSEALGLTGTWINVQDFQNYYDDTRWIYMPTMWRRIA